MPPLRIGVFGGSGFYEMDGFQQTGKVALKTPFGEPSDSFILGTLGNVELVFLPRHGVGHRYNPSEVNYRANVWGMKKLGVSWIIAVSAVGSLREEVVPGDMVLIDSFIDRTFKRQNTFFENGVVGHVQFGEPICKELREMLLAACEESGLEQLSAEGDAARVAERESKTAAGKKCVHMGGTYANMEGPAFSTVAESNMHRMFGARVVGMTNLAEARLAREAEIAFATVAMSTDYDCWREGHDAVTVEDVVRTAKANVGVAKQIVANVVPKIAAYHEKHGGRPAYIANALDGAIMTAPACVTPQAIEDIFWIERFYGNKTPGKRATPEAARWAIAGFIATAVAASFAR